MICLSATALFTVLPLLAPLRAQSNADGPEAFLTWKGRALSLSEAAPDLPEVVREELAAWAPWCIEHGYRVWLDDEAQAILVASARRRDRERLAERERAVIEAIDRIAPRPERDPAETFLATTWGLGQHVPERSPATVAVLEAEPDFDAMLGLLVTLKPFLAGRVPREAQRATFHSGEAGTGALLASPDGIELGTVWRHENEVVNRLARLLLHRRFGSLPYWLEMGLAWNVEQSVQGDIYSFPGRDEFVSIADHSGWTQELKRKFAKRRKQPLELAELAGWSSAKWDAQAAALAWGFARFLAVQPPEQVSRALEDLRLDVKNKGVRTFPDGRWEIVPGYSTPLADQHAILARHLGDDYLERASTAFRTGKY